MTLADSFSIALSFMALAVSLYVFYRDKIYFRGSSVTLANNGARQRAVILKYANAPAALRESVPLIDDPATPCVVARLVWLNTGDRASYVYVSSVQAFTHDRRVAFPFFAYSYIDVAPGAAVFQPVLVYGVTADVTTMKIQVKYSWHCLTRKEAGLLDAEGALLVDLVDDHGLTSVERGHDLGELPDK